MIDVAPTISQISGIRVPAQATGEPIPEICRCFPNALKVAVIAPDALGEFTFRRWEAEMPYLSQLHSQRHLVLESVMPSITPVNFATIVTGNDPSVHRISTLHDTFRCETLFDGVREAGGTSAGIGLTGYTGSLLLGRHADINGDAGDGTDDAVADWVLNIAREKSPRFIIAQLGRVDDVLHQFGPSSEKIIPMLRETDARIQRIVTALKKLDYAILILSDHGQHDVTPEENHGKCGTHGHDLPEDRLVPCTWI
jgi:predicted AlkP superfamily pyrophosphatase or phosphodiesterase